MKTCRVLKLLSPNGEPELCGRPAFKLFENQPICLECYLKIKVVEQK